MARWAADSRGRLERAALTLFAERGYENTTVAEIAARAGVTERTFFRHFADKREVLFGGGDAFQQLILSRAAAAAESASPLEAAAAGVEAAGAVIQERAAYSRERQAVLAANPELRERELIKLAKVSAALSETLRARGVTEPTASLTAESAIAALRIAVELWNKERNTRDLTELVRATIGALRTVAAGLRSSDVHATSAVSR